MKILIISHTPLNFDENNGRTLNNLFNSFKKGDVFQLYFHEGHIQSDVCEDFYRITDFDIAQSIIHLCSAGGIISKQDILNSEKYNKQKDETYGFYSRKSPLIRFMRDVAWGLGTWKNKKLENWLNNINPDVIFFYASDSIFSHRIAKFVCDFLKKPMLIYFVDDYYLKLKYSFNIIRNLINWRFKCICAKNISNSKCICISPLMAEVYSKEFNQQFDVIYTSSFIKPYPTPKHNFPLVISYMGNISVGRNNSIAIIGKIIQEYNLPFILNVYSAETRENILCQIRGKPGVNFHGAIDYNEVQNIMASSDILLHVEGFSQKNIETYRYSLSTKIADSLSSNRCLLAFGPKEVASIDYLIKSDCSLVANTEGQLMNILTKIVIDPSILDKYAEKAYKIAENNHSIENNNDRFKSILEKINR